MSYIGQRPVVGRYIKLDQISSGFNGSETSFSMTAGSQAVFPGTARNLLLSLGGVIQEPDTNFTISGSTLTFTTAPVANTTFFAVIFGDMQSTGTPSDGTVLPASIASSGNFSFPQLTVTGTSSLGDDVTFTGANYNVVWDKSANCLEFTDNAKAKFGTGLDLEIYHDGSESYITDGGTGDLYIQSSAIILEATNGENYFKGIANGAAQVYYDGVTKLQTTSTGITVTAKTQIEGGSGDTELILKRTNTAGSNGNSFGTIKFNDENSNIIGRISTIRSTAADDGDITFAARPTGGSVTEYLRIKSTGHVQIPVDNSRLEIGAGQDLKIAHTGSESYIQNSTGAFQIQSDDLKLFDHSTAHLYFRGQTNSNVELYFDNAKKFETISSGIAVQGTLIDFVGNGGNTTTLKVRNATHTDGTIYGHSSNSDRGFIQVTQSGADFGIQVGGANIGNMRFEAFGDSSTATRICFGTEEMITAAPNGAVELYYDNEKVFYTRGDGVQVQNVNGDGVLYVVGSEGNEAIVKLHADDGDDNADKFQIVSHADNYFAIQNFASGSFENNLKAFGNGDVELYFDNSKKLETTSTGVTVTGQIISDGLQMGDNEKAKFGSHDDLQIFHDGNHSFIQDTGTGDLIIYGTGEDLAKFKDDGSVELYHDGSKKLETDSTGVTVEGQITIDDTGGTAGKGRVRFGNSGHMFIEGQDSGNHGSGSFLGFGQGSNEFMRLKTSTGGLMIGDDGTHAIGNPFLHVLRGGAGTNVASFFFNTTDDRDAILIRHNGATTGTGRKLINFLSDQGNSAGFIICDRTSTTYNTGSDYRLKENEVLISDGITRLKTLKPYRFNFKDNPSKTVDGFFAHEVTAVPEAIAGIKDEVDENGDPKYQGIDQSRLVPLLTAALQEAVGKIETLETKVAALEAA